MKFSEKTQQLIDLYNGEGLYGEDLVNELLRFQAVDQLLAASPQVRQWGITSEDLYQLTCEATSAAFGQVPYSEDVLQHLYGPSFSVDVMDFITETGYLTGIRSGREWEPVLEETLASWAAETEGKVLFAYVEEYAALIEPILAAFGGNRILLHSASETCCSLLQKVYPLAPVTASWPEGEAFRHILAIGAGQVSQGKGPVSVSETVAAGLSVLADHGSARLMLPVRELHSRIHGESLAMEFLFNQERLQAVREWLPYGVCEFELGPEASKKVEISLSELHDGKINTLPLVPLPGSVLGELRQETCFSPAGYALALAGTALEVKKQDVSVLAGLVSEKRPEQPEPDEAAVKAERVLYISRQRGHADFRTEQNPMSGRGLVSISPFEGETASEAGWWEFEDRRCRNLWYAYWQGEEGQAIMAALAGLTQSSASLMQLMGAIRHRPLTEGELENFSKTFDQTYGEYEKGLQAIQAKWAEDREKLLASVR